MKEENANKQSQEIGLNRRKFITTAGVLATGLIVTGLTGCSNTTAENVEKDSKQDNVVAVAQAGAAPDLPWKYNKLDVELVRKRAYEGYPNGGCCYTVAKALLDTLAETSGGHWASIPSEMFLFGAGGAYSWGTLCGALNGALPIINLASDKHKDIGNELIGWYTKFPFPSDKFESYCKIKKQITTIADSPLCHVSVSKWAAAAGAKINEKEKKDRCAKVSGDTAAKAAELLNQALENKVVLAYKVSDEFSHCMSCHQGKDSLRDDEQGKMDCLYCHGDHSKTGKKQ